MIQFDQPKIFKDMIVAAVSSVEDGNMGLAAGSIEEVASNRAAFLGANEIDALQTTLLQVTYEDNTNFTRYVVFDDNDQGDGVLDASARNSADAAVVFRPGHAILLPIADCIGAIIYDPKNEILMVSHLGRHSAEQSGGLRGIHYLVDEFDSDPGTLLVWLSPSVGRDSYPLHSFDGEGLQDIVVDQLLQAGVAPENIEASAVDTADSADYFSHSEYLAGNRDNDGRFAIVAMMMS